MCGDRQPPLWLTPAETAAWLKVTEATILGLVLADQIPYRVVGADILRFPVPDLDEWARKKLPDETSRKLPARPDKAKGPGGRPRGATRARMRALEEEALRRHAAAAASVEASAADETHDGEESSDGRPVT